ncbi:MAG: DUF6318 family protein [Kineosporiaceae bacterium]
MPAVVAGLTTLGLVTSCTSRDDGQVRQPARTVEPYTDAVTPTPTEPPMPTYPAAGKVQTPAGAEAAFRHYVDSYTWAFAHADPQPLIGLTIDGCVFCKSVRDDLADMQSRDERTRGGGLVIHGLQVTRGNIPTEMLLSINMSQNGSITMGREGKPVATTTSHPEQHVDALMQWVNDRWLLREVDF